MAGIFLFILIGGCSTAFDFILYMILIQYMPVFISKSMSMAAASFFSYIANKKYTFRRKSKSNRTCIIRFYTIFAANFFVNTVLNSIMYHLTANRLLSYVIAVLAGMSVNYTGQKLYVFKESGTEKINSE